VDHTIQTTSPEHAPSFISQFLDQPITVVLGSGDGTLHEIINKVSSQPVHFVLVPCGTANALYSSFFPQQEGQDQVAYRLQSLLSFINNKSPASLSLATTTFSSNSQITLSAVVVSTSLHASILHHSESLREQYPGIERFKIAAQENSTKWYRSRLNILPASSQGLVQIYDPQTKSFVNHPNSTLDNPIVQLEGPFLYFLSTVNVDRLEPAFRITPLARTLPPSSPSCDIVVIRPLQSPSIVKDSLKARASFVETIWTVLGAAYQDGLHVQMKYNNDGQVVTEGDGPSVVEYIRCGGWEWIPELVDKDAHLVCSDGAIHTISEGGRAVCNVNGLEHSISVYN
jgi:hypothetical protein